jgi:hypothetical protein
MINRGDFPMWHMRLIFFVAPNLQSSTLIPELRRDATLKRDDEQIRDVAGFRNHNIFVIKPRLQPSSIGHLS